MQENNRFRPVVEVVKDANQSSDLQEVVIESQQNELKKPINPEGEKGLSFKFVVLIAVVTAILVAVISGSVYVYYRSLTKDSISTPTPTSLPQPTVDPEVKQKPDIVIIDKSDYTLLVLNGSGKIGEASVAQELLENHEFNIKQTGNADSFDYEKTIIQAKASVPMEILELVKKALEAVYSVEIVTTSTYVSDDFDITVIVGSSTSTATEE